MDKRQPQIILKTDERKVVLELGMKGKFAVKSTAWDENRVFLEGDRLEVAVVNGRCVLTHLPAKPPAPKPVRTTSRPTELRRNAFKNDRCETALRGCCGVAVGDEARCTPLTLSGRCPRYPCRRSCP